VARQDRDLFEVACAFGRAEREEPDPRAVGFGVGKDQAALGGAPAPGVLFGCEKGVVVVEIDRDADLGVKRERGVIDRDRGGDVVRAARPEDARGFRHVRYFMVRPRGLANEKGRRGRWLKPL